MTWAKFGVEYRGQLMMAGLSDAEARTHTDALLWLYEVESADLRIPKHLLRTIAATADYEQAAKGLVGIGYWRDDGDSWTVLHHADVYRQSLAAQLLHRETERERQRDKRSKAEAKARVGTNVDSNVGETQTDRQTTSQRREAVPPTVGKFDDECIAPGCDALARNACRTCFDHMDLEPGS